MISIIFVNEYIDDVVEEVNAKEALKSSIFVIQKAAAPKTGVESCQSSIRTIRSSYDVWRRRATSLLVIRKLTTHPPTDNAVHRGPADLKIRSKSQKPAEILRFEDFTKMKFRLDSTHENLCNSLNF